MIFNRLVFPYSASFKYPESSSNLFQLKTTNQGLCSLIEVLWGGFWRKTKHRNAKVILGLEDKRVCKVKVKSDKASSLATTNLDKLFIGT